MLFVGDNIKDFPKLSQDSRTNVFNFNRFAHDCIVLPDPMYGSWETNPKL